MLKTEFEKVKQEKDGIEFKIEKFDKASKDLDQLLESQITDKSKKGLGYSAVPPPHPLIYNRPNKLDLSYSGLEEFQQPEFEGYGLRANKSVCENSSNETKKNSDAPLIEEWVFDNEDEVESPVMVKKKTVFPIAANIEFVRPKQHEKPVRKPVKYAEMYRSQRPRGNQRNWNNQKSQQLGSDFVMNNKACFVCGSFDHLKKDYGKRIIKPVWKNTRRVNDHYSTRMTHSNLRRNMTPQAVLTRSGIKAVNTAKPKDAHNTVKRNRFNIVKASACWVWMPKNRVIDHVSKNNSASVTLKRFDYIDAKGRFKWIHRLRGGRSVAKTKDNNERKRISRAEGLKTAGYKVTTAGSRLLLLVKKLMLEHEVLFSEEIALLKRSVGSKEYQMGLLRAELEKLDLSNSGLDEISKSLSFKEWVSDNEDEVESHVVVEKKTDIPTTAKIEKPVRKLVRYAEIWMHRLSVQECSKVKRRIQRRVQQKQKDQEDEVFGKILSAKKIKVTDIKKRAKTRAKQTKPSTRLERARKNESSGALGFYWASP
ncbi:hypothetical protein Tco_1174773 [Tanacetum coccineum]